MPDPARRILVFAPANARRMDLSAALHAAGLVIDLATTLSQGLGQLARRPACAAPPDAVIILEALGGLTPPAIAKAVRGLPGLAAMPIIVADHDPIAAPGIVTVQPPGDPPTICLLAASDPATWVQPAFSAAAPATTPPITPDAIFDPRPLAKLERDVPGTSAEILAAMLDNLAQAAVDLPRLMAAHDLVAIGKLAHRIKGSTGSIGATQCADACAALECAARQDPTSCPQATLVATQAIDRLSVRLRAINAPRT